MLNKGEGLICLNISLSAESKDMIPDFIIGN